ncbi:MAG TPA: hypothetical protein DCF42_08575, partial [Lachnospiraceae bacterium]|nr:hypothetical protein [Lachnospiraceae bacterium]
RQTGKPEGCFGGNRQTGRPEGVFGENRQTDKPKGISLRKPAGVYPEKRLHRAAEQAFSPGCLLAGINTENPLFSTGSGDLSRTATGGTGPERHRK